MTTNGTLNAKLLTLIESWEAQATVARTRADEEHPDNLLPAYWYGVADQLERNAGELRELINRPKPRL